MKIIYYNIEKYRSLSIFKEIIYAENIIKKKTLNNG
jgi:hypothetical protein